MSARAEMAVGGGQRCWEDDGFLEIAFDGVVEEQPMTVLSQLVLSFSLAQGTAEPRSVTLVDISKLGGFTPGARKSLAATKPAKAGATTHTHLFVVGATIRTKALFALVLTAARLIGDTRFETTYVASREEGLTAARAKRDELRAKGLLAPAKTNA